MDAYGTLATLTRDTAEPIPGVTDTLNVDGDTGERRTLHRATFAAYRPGKATAKNRYRVACAIVGMLEKHGMLPDGMDVADAVTVVQGRAHGIQDAEYAGGIDHVSLTYADGSRTFARDAFIAERAS